MSNRMNPVVYRKGGGKAAVFFIHGFTGDAEATWADFPELLAGDPDLSDYDVYSWGYPTKLSLTYTVTKYFWTNDPNIETIGQGLRTLLANMAREYRKIVLIAHSMGGLVSQAFLVEEILKRATDHIGRVTEVIFIGTPSGGLKMAGWGSFLKNQISDMSVSGEFIQDLRSQWKQLIDDQRANPDSPAQFRLTVAAGMQDNFVPPESSLSPFPLDEHEIIPGNHSSMIKPTSRNDLVYQMVKNRLVRGTLTRAEWERVNGKSEEVIKYINRIGAAANLRDSDDLVGLADKLLAAGGSIMPLVDRALGLALLDVEQYDKSAALLERYLSFRPTGTSEPRFAKDVQAIQQLSIALSGSGRITEAVARLNEVAQLFPELKDDPETQGILAGRFKRQWLKSRDSVPLGRQVYRLYKDAFESAKRKSGPDQQFYNGINAAYMSFAAKVGDFEEMARATLAICDGVGQPDYWCEATRAEAYLLLGDYDKADKAYEKSLDYGPSDRHLTSTGQQALDIIRRQGDPPAAEPIKKRFAGIKPDYAR